MWREPNKSLDTNVEHKWHKQPLVRTLSLMKQTKTRCGHPIPDKGGLQSDHRKTSPGPKTKQVLLALQGFSPARAVTAVITKPGDETRLLERIYLLSENEKEPEKEVIIRIYRSNCLSGAYVGPQLSEGNLGKLLTRLHEKGEDRVIISGDLNAR